MPNDPIMDPSQLVAALEDRGVKSGKLPPSDGAARSAAGDELRDANLPMPKRTNLVREEGPANAPMGTQL